MFVQVSVILAGSEFSIFLLDKEEGRCLWRGQGSDLSGLEVFVNKVICGFPFIWREGVYFANFRDESVFHVNFVVVRLGGGKVSGCWFFEDLFKG